jgi:precorrin-6Y C5,15-methyltransferase (decarboxylating)
MSGDSKPWITIVGVGADGEASLGPEAKAAIAAADLLVGFHRHLDMFPQVTADKQCLNAPFAAAIEGLRALKTSANRRVVVLASGDPMSFGLGATLARRLDPTEIRIIPAVGSIALACARMRWPAEEVTTVSVCGRPVECVALHLAPDAKLVVLSADGTSPAAVAALLVARGYGPSAMTVLESLGAADERAASSTAEAWTEPRVGDLNVIAVECRARSDARRLARTPGLPDDAFEHDGQITKREMRALAIAALAPLPGECLWDVGAGSGSVAIEWMRAASRTHAIAIERKPERAALIARNAKTLGVPTLKIIEGTAPEALAGLAPPDAVFVGGGVSEPGVIEAAWSALKPGGRLVAHAVSVEGEARLITHARALDGRLTRIGIERAEPLGERTGFRPARAVTQLVAEKASKAS